jgi:trans-cinnamate 4-monooxygenase
MDRETDIIFYCLMSRKVMAQTGEIRCAMDHILEAERKGEINHDNVLYIVENINVAGNSSVSSTFFYIQNLRSIQSTFHNQVYPGIGTEYALPCP